MNVSFSQSAGAGGGDPLVYPLSPTSRANLSTSASAFDLRSRGTARGRTQNSVRADSVRRSEGRRMSQDTRRYMQAAAASSQTTLHQLLSRLQTYRTFQPFLSAPAPYRDGSVSDERGFGSSLGGPLRGRGSTAAVNASQLWQMVDGLLDTSVAQLLQHNVEGHFIMTLQSTLGLEARNSMAKIRTVIESRKTPATTTGAAAGGEPGGEERTAAAAPHRPPPRATAFAPTSAFANRWSLDHPSASAAEAAGQRHAWASFDQQRQHTSRSFYLKAMQDQLDALEAEEATGAADALPQARRSHAARTARPEMRSFSHSGDVFDALQRSSGRHATAAAAHDEESAAQVEATKQRALWQAFHDGAARPTGALNPSSATAADAPRIVSAHLNSTDLKDWLHSSWAHRTHRHESAALRIQCAYRVYRARCETRQMRYARRQAFLSSLGAEREARRVWDVALQVQTDSTTTASGADSTMRALQFFINKVNAVVEKRRARKRCQQQQAAEVRHYAAVRIQAVYRGHCARVFVEELRHPEIAEQRERLYWESCARVIQACWRRFVAQRQWRRIRHAACVLQTMYRCRAARRLLAERRYTHNIAAAAELRKFAVQRIEHWYAACLAVRNAIGGAHMAELLTLQRIGRGYRGRLHTHEEARRSQLRRAVRIIERRRRRVVERRDAVALRAALIAGAAAQRAASMHADAAVTIQRAWRQRRTQSAG
ncbi:IQ calmodulin-binding motif containing protein [Novymonas esmeraldas]|uniref:IQ calmodulin-binding motif containing protein n=1 Tax=Novymonas esmeraldas TaxID=1808958 RepID=A0AAW0EPZ2_9TRYP